jgi:hypothetical protein
MKETADYTGNQAGANFAKCGGSAAGASGTYRLAQKGTTGYIEFDPKGGVGGTDQGTTACLLPFEAADIPGATDAKVPKVLVGKVYTNKTCTTTLCGAGTDTNKCGGSGKKPATGVAIASTGAHDYTLDADFAKVSDVILMGGGDANAATFDPLDTANVSTAVQATNTDLLKSVGIASEAMPAVPKLAMPTAGVDGLQFTYHNNGASGSDACKAVHTAGWQPHNADAGKITCIPLNDVFHEDCEGVNKCADAVNAVLVKLTADTGDTAKCKTGSGADATTNANTQCSKACQCIDSTNSPFLNWAWATAAANKATHGSCWLSDAQPGVLDLDIFANPTLAAVSSAGLSRAATGALLALGNAKQATVNSKNCGTLALEKETTVADPDLTNAEFTTVWSKTGCGYTKKDDTTGGASSTLASTVTSVLVLIAGAALL